MAVYGDLRRFTAVYVAMGVEDGGWRMEDGRWKIARSNAGKALRREDEMR